MFGCHFSQLRVPREILMISRICWRLETHTTHTTHTIMKLKLKNDSGMMREVPTGFSWTGFFFQYFVLFSRGLFGRAFLLMTVAFTLQLSSCVVQCSAGAASALNGESSQQVAEAMNGASLFTFFVVFLPFAIIIGMKINKWTERYWLDRGYKPTGSGWKFWGPKWGLDPASVPNE